MSRHDRILQALLDKGDPDLCWKLARDLNNPSRFPVAGPWVPNVSSSTFAIKRCKVGGSGIRTWAHITVDLAASNLLWTAELNLGRNLDGEPLKVAIEDPDFEALRIAVDARLQQHGLLLASPDYPKLIPGPWQENHETERATRWCDRHGVVAKVYRNTVHDSQSWEWRGRGPDGEDDHEFGQTFYKSKAKAAADKALFHCGYNMTTLVSYDLDAMREAAIRLDAVKKAAIKGAKGAIEKDMANP